MVDPTKIELSVISGMISNTYKVIEKLLSKKYKIEKALMIFANDYDYWTIEETQAIVALFKLKYPYFTLRISIKEKK